MFGRARPEGKTTDDEYEARLSALAQVMGREWFGRAPLSHPLGAVWWRKDWLATVELAVLGRAVGHLVKHSEPATIEHWARTARKLKGGQLRGHLWEAFAAGMLADDAQAVRFAPAKQPGYDLIVEAAGGRSIRVSCKRLMPSDSECRLRRLAASVYSSLRASLPPGPALNVGMRRTSPPGRRRGKNTHRKLVRAILSMKSVGSIHTARHEIHVDPLIPEAGARFEEPDQSRSLKFAYASPRAPGDQVRFERKVKVACENLSQHAPLPGPDSENIVMMRVPQSVLLEDARRWLADFFAQTSFAHVNSVLLIRPAVHWREEGPFRFVYHLNYESVAFDNPNCPSRADRLQLIPYLGRPGEGEGVFSLVARSLGEVRSTDHYIHVDGHVYYSDAPWRGSGPAGLGVPVLPHFRPILVEPIPDGPTLRLGADLGGDFLGLRERARPHELVLL